MLRNKSPLSTHWARLGPKPWTSSKSPTDKPKAEALLGFSIDKEVTEVVSKSGKKADVLVQGHI